jgi:ferredoxin-NADP reductase
MARAALPGRLTWQLVSVVELVQETERAKSLVLTQPDWPGGYRSGQHVDVRLTAEDGYEAQRSYSIASAPEDEHLVLTVERLDDGEVSPYLVDVLRPGDELELRGPIGGYFVWEEALGGPLVLIGGGSGVVPLRSMLRHWSMTARGVPARLVYSSRRLSEVIFRDELLGYASRDGVDLRLVLTREWPDDWQGHRGRIDETLVDEVAGSPEEGARIYICGPNAFVEAASGWLAHGGRDPGRIRTERFGPTGT